MLVVPEFSLIHLSKTGGTFAEETIRELLCPSPLGRKVHRLKIKYGVKIPFFPYRYDECGHQHALCNDIPASLRDRTILSFIRNPFDLYVSEYTFNWWKKYPERWFYEFPKFEKEYPAWRNLAFTEFYKISNRRASWVQRTLVKFPNAENLGWYSHKFVYYYCRDHDYVFAAANDLEAFVARVKETMYPVHFVHTERLNQELYEFLLSKGYPQEKIGHIPNKEKVNASRKDHNWRKWYNDELRQEVERRDALIFRLFPEYQF